MHLKLDSELARLAGLPAPFAELFTRGDVTVELFAPKGADAQTPHDRDEIYIVARGTGLFRLEDRTMAFGPGDFLFVPAWAEHRFEQFSEDFATWVAFFGPVRARPGGAAP